jgi:RNA polymerase sigma-70 factor (ECF subfamily)
MPLPDDLIIQRVLGGDREAFGLLVDRYQERCTRLAVHIIGDREDAEDAVQETFLRAFRSLEHYEERQRFAAWLFHSLINQCRSLARRRKRRAAFLPNWERSMEAASFDPAPAEQSELRDALRRALERLDPPQREAVVLRFADELTYDEMAAVTGVGVSALKMRVQRACARLRAFLEVNHV